MTYTHKSNITYLRASKTRIYPFIRLPTDHGAPVGKSAEIIPTSYEGKQAFLVVTNQKCLKQTNHNRVSSKTIRKRHLNLMVTAGISESLADFIESRAPATLGSAHYLNKVQQEEAYRRIVEKDSVLLETV